MNIEQLKLILDTVQGVSGDAMKAGMAYIAYLLLKELLAYAMGVFVVVVIYKGIIKATAGIRSESIAESAINSIRAEFGQSREAYLSRYDVDSTISKVRELKRSQQ